MKNASIKPPVLPQACRLPIELVSAVNSIASLRAAVDNGADCIRLVIEPPCVQNGASSVDATALPRGIAYAHARKKKVVLELPLPMRADSWEHMRKLIRQAECFGIDALAFSDPAIMLYCIGNCPDLPLHYAPITDDLHCGLIRDFHRRFGVSRVILPSVSSLPLIKQVLVCASIEVEVRVFGESSTIVAGRNDGKDLRAVGQSPKANVHVARFNPDAEESCSDRCATAEHASNDCNYASGFSPDASSLEFVPRLNALGVRAVRIEGLHNDVAQVGRIMRVWREALDTCHDSPEHYTVKPAWANQLNRCARNAGVC